MDRYPALQGLSLEFTLKPLVHRVRKPNLFDPMFDKGLEKIAFKFNIMDAVTLGPQLLLISLHGGSMKHQFLLVELEREVTSREIKLLFY